jgi:hypothetical protein
VPTWGKKETQNFVGKIHRKNSLERADVVIIIMADIG